MVENKHTGCIFCALDSTVVIHPKKELSIAVFLPHSPHFPLPETNIVVLLAVSWLGPQL